MDLYSRRNLWKQLLLLAAALIITFSVIYTQRIASAIQKQEVERVKSFALSYEILNTSSDPAELEAALGSIKKNTDIPVIWATASDEINGWKNFDSTHVRKRENYLPQQIQYLRNKGQMVIIKAEGIEPQYLYYKESALLQNLKKYPYYQLILVTLFIIVALVAYNTSRNAEQNRIWVGMAKETAHQLGTPLSSISAWIEILRDKLKDEEGKGMVDDLQKDVDRLELIADRFSKIGSPPKLEPVDISALVIKSVNYIHKRASRNITMTVNDTTQGGVIAMASPHLLEWVLENLLKNALDAMDSKGKIVATISETHAQVIIDVKDNGKGIERSNIKMVFEPGFSTKKRGWGLGLTLSRRIMVQYHNGEIFVKESAPSKGTTFRVILNKA